MFGNIVFKFPTNRAIALISRFPGVTLNIQIYQSLIFIHEFNKHIFYLNYWHFYMNISNIKLYKCVHFLSNLKSLHMLNIPVIIKNNYAQNQFLLYFLVRKFYINDIQDTLQSIDFNDDIAMELFLNLFSM